MARRFVEAGLRQAGRLLIVAAIFAALAHGFVASHAASLAAARDDSPGGFWMLSAAADPGAAAGLPSKRAGAGSVVLGVVAAPPRPALSAPARTLSPDGERHLAFSRDVRFLPRQQIP